MCGDHLLRAVGAIKPRSVGPANVGLPRVACLDQLRLALAALAVLAIVACARPLSAAPTSQQAAAS